MIENLIKNNAIMLDCNNKKLFINDKIAIKAIKTDVFTKKPYFMINGVLKYKYSSIGHLGAGFGILQENGKFTYLSGICQCYIEKL